LIEAAGLVDNGQGWTMRAAYLLEPGRIDIRDVPDPTPGPGELVVRIENALTCGTDLKAFRRGHPFIPMPGPFGHQYSGRVEQVGPGAGPWEPGEPIAGVHSGPCQECSACRSQKFNLCERITEQLLIGAFAEKLLIRPRVAAVNIHPRPAGMSALRAAFLEPVSCCVHTLGLLDFRGVDRVLVLGTGSMGLLFLQLLPFYTGAARVAAGRRSPRLAIARGYGLEQVIDVEATPLAERREFHRQFDLVIECTGRPEGWQEAIDATRPGGQVMLFGGLPKGSTFPVDTYRLHYEELRLIGSFHFSPADVSKSLEYLSSPLFAVEEMIAGTRPLEGLAEALDDMAQGRAIKFAICPDRRDSR
jgi:L-iditol 2-dehydrogenase